MALILGTIHILRQPILQVLSTFVRKMLPQALIIPSVVILFDSYFYGKLTIVPWNFVKFNIINNISEQYGIEPWHWYLTNFLPSLTLGIGIYPVIKGMYKTFASSSGDSLMPKVTLVSALWTLFVYSSLKHKEHRFLLPLVPLLLAYMAVGLPKIRSTR
jgi:phosphatidylinositol glycan class B